jgi:hypothetical protein
VQILAVPGAMSYDFGFLRIVNPPLVANIMGRKHVVKNKEEIILDGSLSVDPLRRRLNYRYLKFSWYCKKEGEEFPKSDSSFVDIPNKHSVLSSSGCFGFGTGKLSIKERILRLNTKRMDVGEYVFKLTVAKRDRKPTSTMYKVTLVPPASVDIRLVLQRYQYFYSVCVNQFIYQSMESHLPS